MAKYNPYDYNQHAMVDVNFNDQIQPGTFEYALHYLIEQRVHHRVCSHASKPLSSPLAEPQITKLPPKSD